MKGMAGLAVAAALVAGTWASSADAAMKGGAEHKNVLTTNAFNFIIATFGAEYERVLGESGGVYGAFRYGSYDFGSGVKATWPGLSAGYHWYPAKHSPTGFFVGPLLWAQFMTFTFTGPSLTTGSTISEDVTATFIGPMVDLGTRWDWGGFVLSPSVQVGYLTGSAKAKTTNVSSPSFGGFVPFLGLNVGAAF